MSEVRKRRGQRAVSPDICMGKDVISEQQKRPQQQRDTTRTRLNGKRLSARLMEKEITTGATTTTNTTASNDDINNSSIQFFNGDFDFGEVVVDSGNSSKGTSDSLNTPPPSPGYLLDMTPLLSPSTPNNNPLTPLAPLTPPNSKESSTPLSPAEQSNKSPPEVPSSIELSPETRFLSDFSKDILDISQPTPSSCSSSASSSSSPEGSGSSSGTNYSHESDQTVPSNSPKGNSSPRRSSRRKSPRSNIIEVDDSLDIDDEFNNSDNNNSNNNNNNTSSKDSINCKRKVAIVSTVQQQEQNNTNIINNNDRALEDQHKIKTKNKKNISNNNKDIEDEDDDDLFTEQEQVNNNNSELSSTRKRRYRNDSEQSDLDSKSILKLKQARIASLTEDFENDSEDSNSSKNSNQGKYHHSIDELLSHNNNTHNTGENNTSNNNNNNNNKKKTPVATVLPQPQKKSVSFAPGVDLSLTKPKKKNLQVVPYQQRHLTISRPAVRIRPGKVISLKMKNVMSHSVFEKSWHPNINYIVGENGSGKSSIMAGILLALGAKAAVTGRATSAKELVQQGKSKAKIELILANDGSLNPIKYGNQIIIIRIISTNGTSRYQISTPDNTFRSLERREMKRILATLQIMPENPFQFLNQETAKNFLRTSDPRKKYKYFYKATSLEECEMLLDISKKNVMHSKATLESNLKMAGDLEKKTQQIHEKLDLIRSMEKAKAKIPLLDREHSWSLVSESENKLKEEKECLRNSIMKYTALTRAKKKYLNGQAQVVKKIESRHNALEECKNEIKIKRRVEDVKRNEVKTIKGKYIQVNVQLKNAISSLNNSKQELQSVQDGIASTNKGIQTDYEKRKEDLEKKRDVNATKLKKAKELLMESQSVVNGMSTTLETCINEEQELQARLKHIEAKQRECKKEKTSALKTHNINPYQRFGNDMVRLINEINTNAHKFKKRPRGPLGACFTVNDEKYAPLVEFILNENLYQFFVDNQEDMNLLKSIVKKVYGSNIYKKNAPTYYLSKFKDKAFNISHGRVNCQYPTILDKIDIVDNDPIVFNWLIDCNSIERVLLFQDREEAFHLLKDLKKAPKNVLRAFTLDFYRITHNPTFRTYPHKERYKTYLVHTTKHSDDNKMEQIEHELSILNNDILKTKKLLEEAKKKSKVLKDKYNSKNFEISTYRKELVTLQSVLSTIEESLLEVPDNSLNNSKEAIEECQADVKEKEIEVNKYRELSKKYGGEQKELDNVFKTISKEVQDIEDKMKKLDSDKGIDIQANEEYKRKIAQIQDLLTKTKEIQQEYTKRCKDTEKEMKNLYQIAKHKCARVPYQRESSVIKREWEAIESAVKKNKFKISEKKQVEEDYLHAKDVAEKVDLEIKTTQKLMELFVPVLECQDQYFKRKKQEYGQNLQSSFYSFITSRQYGGFLELNHEEKTLVCFVAPDDSAKVRAMGNFALKGGELRVANNKGLKDYTCGLSGGERSFATICFLISLWKIMEAPFYILDEFDVFMDPINLKASQRILMIHAKSQPEAQFFFFSPLDIKDMPNKEEATVLKLSPPIRGIEAPSPNDKSGLEKQDNFNRRMGAKRLAIKSS